MRPPRRGSRTRDRRAELGGETCTELIRSPERSARFARQCWCSCGPPLTQLARKSIVKRARRPILVRTCGAVGEREDCRAPSPVPLRGSTWPRGGTGERYTLRELPRRRSSDTAEVAVERT